MLDVSKRHKIHLRTSLVCEVYETTYVKRNVRNVYLTNFLSWERQCYDLFLLTNMVKTLFRSARSGDQQGTNVQKNFSLNLKDEVILHLDKNFLKKNHRHFSRLRTKLDDTFQTGQFQ